MLCISAGRFGTNDVQKSPAILTDCRAFCVHQASKLSAGTGAFLRQRGLGRGAFSCKRKSPAEPAARKRFFCARMFSGLSLIHIYSRAGSFLTRARNGAVPFFIIARFAGVCTCRALALFHAGPYNKRNWGARICGAAGHYALCPSGQGGR